MRVSLRVEVDIEIHDGSTPSQEQQQEAVRLGVKHALQRDIDDHPLNGAASVLLALNGVSVIEEPR